MPANAIIGPALVLLAAAFIASAWAAVRAAAPIVASFIVAVFCRSLIICSSSGEAVTELTPNETTSIPLSSPHFFESTSLSASAISVV